MNKKDMRSTMIERRDRLTPNEIRVSSRVIEEKLIERMVREEVRSVFTFISFGSEVDTHSLIGRLLHMGIEVSVPKIEGGKMYPVVITSMEDLVPGRMGILEPIEGRRADTIDMVIVPGVVFDRRGYRIGYGGGYYDRYLMDIPSHIPRVAIAHEMQIVEEIPVDSWDMRIDHLITEGTIYNFKRIEDYGIRIGSMERGPLNKITDVAGVSVGHATVDTSSAKTGVTVISPSGNIYENKLIGAVHVINGFGKSTGLIQIEELGEIESPIALTNTLSVGRVSDALIDEVLRSHPNVKTYNPIVGECNDSYLNDIGRRGVDSSTVEEAFARLTRDFIEGDVGAGKGVSCHKLKGGIGSASRCFYMGEEKYTLGILVQSNYGMLEDLTIDGYRIGEAIRDITDTHLPDRGSIMIVAATDLPVSSRQLRRICSRAVNGLARLGSFTGSGSGEIVIGFSTGNTLSGEGDYNTIRSVREEELNKAFKAIGEATEEAVLNSMVCASPVTGIEGHIRESLADYMYLLKRR